MPMLAATLSASHHRRGAIVAASEATRGSAIRSHVAAELKQNMIDDVTRRQKRSGADACRAVNTLRVRKQLDALSVTAVHSYINGATHARGRADRRGHGQRLLTTVHVRKLACLLYTSPSPRD